MRLDASSLNPALSLSLSLSPLSCPPPHPPTVIHTRRMVQAELVHARWAMLGVAGILFTSVSLLAHTSVFVCVRMGGMHKHTDRHSTTYSQ